MVGGMGPGGGLIGIRTARKPGPDPAAAPDVTVIVASAPGADLEDRVRRAVDVMRELGDPFEMLVVAPRDGSRPLDAASIDPRVRLLDHEGPSDLPGVLSAAAGAARSDFVLPILPGAELPTADQIRALRDAMDPLGAFSYLPGSAASDLAISAPPRGLVGRFVSARMPGLFASDYAGPFMVRREVAGTISFDGDGPDGLRDLALKAKASGRIVRKVTL